MKLHSRSVLSTIFILVLLCFTFISVKQTTVRYWEKVKKEDAVSKIISVTPTSFAQREKIRKEEAVSRITDYIRDENVELEDKVLKTISEMVYKESMRYNIDYRLVLALMKIESNFRCDAVSEKGARGLLQVKPSLARYIAEDVGIRWRGDETLDEPKKNIRIGVHVFSKLIEDFQNTNMALHAYHVGPTRLREILTEKKIPQKRYLNLVLNEYDRNISLLPAP
jgi:soluble lytic murein transglycosylase